MDEQITRYAHTRKKPNPWVIALIVLIHIGIFYILVRSLAPSAVARVEQSVVSAFTVTVTAPEPEPEEPTCSSVNHNRSPHSPEPTSILALAALALVTSRRRSPGRRA